MTQREEEGWAEDINRGKTRIEVFFQHTAMMNSFNRHTLGKTLDWIPETMWPSDFPSPRDKFRGKSMPRPRPDVAVGFKASAVVLKFGKACLDPVRQYVFPEVEVQPHEERAFQFFTIEAKNPSKVYNGVYVTHLQNVNNAMHVLYNMWKFMVEVGQEETFFSRVRFVSVASSPIEAEVRIHRAERAPNWVRPLNGGFPPGFNYDVLEHFAGERYTMTKVQRVIGVVLLRYGVEKLLPILRSATREYLNNRSAEAAAQSFDSQASASDLGTMKIPEMPTATETRCRGWMLRPLRWRM